LLRKKAMPSSINPAITPVKTTGLAGKNQIHSHVWNSFLGSERVLDLFEPEILAQAQLPVKQSDTASEEVAETVPAVASSLSNDFPSEEFIQSVADRVVRQMSPDLIREVAWEVVPELSEVLIRRVIEEQRKP
jgi:hypothetical protein